MKKKNCFLIAEIGLSHEGSVGIAKSYIDLATDLGFDAIKFQTHNADDESSKQEAFRSKIFFQDKTRFDYWKRTSFDNDTWLFLKKYCDKKKIIFISSAFSEKSLKVLKKIGQKYWKIPSGEVTNLILIEQIAKLKKHIFLSTGMSTFSEIKEALKIIRKHHNKITLMHCTSEYPTKPDNVNLQLINTMSKKFNIDVGYSDHTGELSTCLIANYLGAVAAEIHITFSKKMFGADASSSIELNNLQEWVRSMKFVDTIKNQSLSKDQISKKLNFMKKLFEKSLIASENLKKGEKFKLEDFILRKPGNGLSAKYAQKLIGKRIKKNYLKNQLISKNEIF